MPRVALHTLGCKVNQYETQRIAEDFRSRGFDLVDFSDEADVYVINTCTVTQTADSKSRQAARAAVNRNPNAKVVLTGCYAETSTEQLRRIDGVSMVLGNRDKSRLVEHVVGELSFAERVISDQSPVISDRCGYLSRTRALLKIQDGCDQFCAYCAVPLARPEMVSRPFVEVLSEAEELARRGYKEIVLTGIRLGLYDFGLVELIRSIVELPGIERVRLSSIELTDIPTGLPELMADNRKLCRHLHVPLQSGDDEILARMKRPYTSSQFESFVRDARSLVPEIAITTDIMVGFPGETEEQFEHTYGFSRRVNFARTHVFPYSPRIGTAAWEMADDIPPAEKSRRKARMIELAAECSDEFAAQMIGTTVGILVEGGKPGRDGGPEVKRGAVESAQSVPVLSAWNSPRLFSACGLTDNYVRVAFRGGPAHVGEIVDVTVESVARGMAHGHLVSV